MKILSLFDGMACGMIAMLNAGIEVESYDAYEIDKYAIKVSSHNFPNIKHHGDVFQADFTQYEGVDYLVGGSPCTYWSIAQTRNRETVASGMGWELFSQYVRAVKEAKPRFFIYENNKSMSAAIRESIDRAFGFEAVCINSALVSAQNRQRLYWVGIRNEDGTYSKVSVDQPEDRGVLLRDVLDNAVAWRDKSHTIDASYYKGGNLSSFTAQSGQRFMAAEPVSMTEDGKAHTLKAQYYKNGMANFVTNGGFVATAVAEVLNVTADGKARTVRATCYKDGIRNMVGNDIDRRTCVAEPVRVGAMPIPNGELSTSQAFRVYDTNDKSVTLNANGGGAGGKTGLYAEPLRVHEATKQGYAEIEVGDCVDLTHPNSKTRRGRSMKEKSNCLTTSQEWYQYCGTLQSPIYEVRDGMITIKGKQYPIKLVDGFYIIRKLTVTECMRLQTVPEWYDFSAISNSQAYKCLGNGWTCEVITHLINATQKAARRKWLKDLLGDCL